MVERDVQVTIVAGLDAQGLQRSKQQQCALQVLQAACCACTMLLKQAPRVTDGLLLLSAVHTELQGLAAHVLADMHLLQQTAVLHSGALAHLCA